MTNTTVSPTLDTIRRYRDRVSEYIELEKARLHGATEHDAILTHGVELARLAGQHQAFSIVVAELEAVEEGFGSLDDYAFHMGGEPCLRAMTTADCQRQHFYGHTYNTSI
jgi:hypothetical protein